MYLLWHVMYKERAAGPSLTNNLWFPYKLFARLQKIPWVPLTARGHIRVCLLDRVELSKRNIPGHYLSAVRPIHYLTSFRATTAAPQSAQQCLFLYLPSVCSYVCLHTEICTDVKKTRAKAHITMYLTELLQ